MANQNSIIRVEREGVEFFTVAKSGESGMSQRGLARHAGIDEKQVRRFLADKKDAILCTERVGSRTVTIVRDFVCAELIAEYAQQGKPEAIRSLIGFAAIGIRIFIQGQTGWQPKSEVQQFVEAHLLRDARTWEAVFDRQWIKAAEQCTGWKWSYQAMSRLINLVVYDQLPKEVRLALDQYNPVLDDGHRARKQHQHFSNESVEQVLRMQIDIARSLLLVSTSWDELKENSRRRFEGMSQLRLLP